MKMSFQFTVTARCNIYKQEELLGTEDIELHLNKMDAANFIFRFAPNAFTLNGYKVMLKYNNNSFVGIILIKEDNIYIVKNFNQVLADITEGYIRSRLLEKTSSILEFDFESLINSDDIADEFEDESNNTNGSPC